MATFRLTFLTCDRCGEEFDGAEALAGTLREQAERAGWSVNKHGGECDVCADCIRTMDARRG